MRCGQSCIRIEILLLFKKNKIKKLEKICKENKTSKAESHSENKNIN